MKVLLLALCVASLCSANPNQWTDRQVYAMRSIHRRAAITKATPVKYSSVVAFGASYVDNGHPRDKKYSDSLRGPPYVGGRFTNGPTIAERLVEAMALNSKSLNDYAFAGAVIDNTIPGEAKTVPDSGMQMQTYLTALQKSSVSRGKDRVLHFIWDCINPLTVIWNNWQSDGDLTTANHMVDLNIQALLSQIGNLTQSALLSNGGVKGNDFMIPMCPPLENMPNLYYQAIPAGSPTKLAQLKVFRQRFETGIAAGLQTLAAGQNTTRIASFDTVSWWNSVIANPKKYGLTNVKDPCYDSSTGKVCKIPATYFYFDTLHPTTTTFQMLAKAMWKSWTS